MIKNETEMLLNSYGNYAQFISTSLGMDCLAVVYSVENEECDGKVTAVYGALGGRRVGDPITPFLRRIAIKLRKNDENGVTHVDTEASTAEGRVKLSIFGIRTSDGKLVGLFIICTQIDLFYNVQQAVNAFLGYTVSEDTYIKAESVADAGSLSDFTNRIIQEEINSMGVPVDRMSINEKRDIILNLEKREVFFVRDSVRITANLLGISVPTLYRLLKQDGGKKVTI